MHKKLEAELVSLANSILQMKNKDDVNALQKKAQETGQIKRTLIGGVSGVVAPTNRNIGGMDKLIYNPTREGLEYFQLYSESPYGRKIISADEVYFLANENGTWEIYARNPQFI